MQQFDPKVYWEQRMARTTGLQGVGYMGLGQAFNAWMYRVRRHVFLRTVRRHMPQRTSSDVLDVGSGTGEYLRSWQRSGIGTVRGSDLTNTAVERLRIAFPGMDLRQLDISEAHVLVGETYDAISCMDVLFHIVDDTRFERTLINFHGALRPGGLLIISDEFVHGKQHRQTHFVTRTLLAYEQALTRNGFRVVQRRPVFHLMNSPTDTDSPWLHRWWGVVLRITGRSHFLGGVLAALVFPLELSIVSLRREGVGTEIMVCERMS